MEIPSPEDMVHRTKAPTKKQIKQMITCSDAELLKGVIGISRLPKTIPPNEDVFNTIANAVKP